MSDPESFSPNLGTCYAFTPDMNDDLVEKFTNQTFNQGSALLKIRYYNPKDLIVQHLPIKGREKKIGINRMRNSYIIDTLKTVDIQKIAKNGGKVIQVNEGVIDRKNFKVSPFKKLIDKLFELRQKHTDENNDVMQFLVKLIMISLYGEQIRKDIKESYQCKSEMWMQTEYDGRLLDYQKINYGN